MASNGDGVPDGRRGTATFEELMAELEQITATLSAGDLGIEAAAELYVRAEELHALASARLEQVKARVEGLTRSAADPAEKGGLPETGKGE